GVALASNPTVSDPDSTTFTGATVKITGGTFAGDGDVMRVLNNFTSGSINLINFSYDSATETMTFSGANTAANYQIALSSVSFLSTSDNPTDFGSDPTRTVTWTVADDFNVESAPVTTTVSITAINDAPSLTSVASTVTYTAGTTIALSPTTSLTDVDSLNMANATVKITGGFVGDGDVLAANVAGTHITTSYDPATETMTLTGSDPVATYQAVIDS